MQIEFQTNSRQNISNFHFALCNGVSSFFKKDGFFCTFKNGFITLWLPNKYDAVMGVPVVISGNNLPSPIVIGLTDLPNIGGATGPPGPPGSGITEYYIIYISPTLPICLLQVLPLVNHFQGNCDPLNLVAPQNID